MLVKHYPKILEQINFNVPFATDDIILDRMKRHYRMYSYLYKCIEDNIAALQDVADLKREYYKELYDTTQFEYNPIENYNMVESEHIDDKRTTDNSNVQTPHNWITSVKQGGYEDGGTAVETSESTQTGTYTTEDNGHNNDLSDRTLTRKGNIGVTTTQQMIQSSRDIILNLIEMYVNEFADCFNIEL